MIYLEKENCTRQANGKKDKQDDAGLLEADMLDPWWAGALQMNRLRDLCARPTRRCSAILHPSQSNSLLDAYIICFSSIDSELPIYKVVIFFHVRDMSSPSASKRWW